MVAPQLLALFAAGATSAPSATSAVYVDDATAQSVDTSQRWLGPAGTVIERLGSLPRTPWLDPREVRRRGPHGEVIVPLIGIDERAAWSDGALLCVEDPFAETSDERARLLSPPPGVTYESEGRGRLPHTRVVVDGAVGPWFDDVAAVERAPDGRTLVIGAVLGGGPAAQEQRLLIDERVVDRVPGGGSNGSGSGSAGFFRAGRRAFWNVRHEETRVIDGDDGKVASFPCDVVTGPAALGSRGLLLDCIFRDGSFVVVDNDGHTSAHALNVSRPLRSWWVSDDGAHFISANDRWVVVDGVRGPEARLIWDLRIEEGRAVQYLALLAPFYVDDSALDVVQVTMPWPRAFCGEPFVEWRLGAVD